MAKNTAKKPSLKPTPSPATPAPVAEKATKVRGPVLVEKTPAELANLIGEDTKVGVSIKHLKELRTKKLLADSDLGI